MKTNMKFNSVNLYTFEKKRLFGNHKYAKSTIS